MYSIKKAGLLKKMYKSIRFKKGIFPDVVNDLIIMLLKTIIQTIDSRLKIVINRNMLKMAGDLPSVVLKVSLLLYNGRNDCIRPFIQNELTRAEKNIKNSYSPIASVASLLFASTILIINRVPYLST
jgi:hypothetical protein